MFDWNDEELANIIWVEAGVSDDHIVPYPEGSEEKTAGIYGDCIKNEPNQEATIAKPAKPKKAVAKTGYSGGKQEGPSQCVTTNGISSSEYSMDPWPGLPLTNALKTDQDFMGTEVSNNLSEITNFDSSRGDETSQLVNDSEVFRNQHEDMEQSDFVDYDWTNVGSFDDLDRIFSNGDPMFGHASVGNTGELWSSSKDVTSSPEKTFPLSMDSPNVGLEALKNTYVHFDVKTEYAQDQDQSSILGSAKMSYLTSHTPQNLHASAEWLDNSGGKTKPVEKEKFDVELLGKTLAFNSHLAAENIKTLNEFTDKVKNQKRSLRGRKKSVGCEEQLQDSCCTWSPHANQFEQLSGQISPSIPQNCTPVICHQTQLLGPASPQYQHYPNPFMGPLEYESNKNQSTLSCLPQINGREYDKAALPGYEVSTSKTNPSSRSPGASTLSLIMTPQEKIQKLRRRQQMQALLAIQEQQQQFSHQVSGIDHSTAQKRVNEKKIQQIQGGNIEVEQNVSALPSIDPNSPIEQDDSNTITMPIDEYYSVEDTILHQLQDIIARLDIRIRLCIRDSLFRLAESATQRHYATNTSSTNKNCKDELEAVGTEETRSHSRFTPTRDVETQTNPIDRTVAHLLFHRPLELSGLNPETPEPPASTKLPCERNSAGVVLSSPTGFLPDHYRSKQNPSHHVSKNPHLFAGGDRSRNSLRVDTSNNAWNDEVADGGGMEIEASR